MTYKTLQIMTRNRNRFLFPFNAADGTQSDNSTDTGITRDPNDYLVPRADGNGLIGFILLLAAVMSIVTSMIVIIPLIKKQL